MQYLFDPTVTPQLDTWKTYMSESGLCSVGASTSALSPRLNSSSVSELMEASTLTSMSFLASSSTSDGPRATKSKHQGTGTYIIYSNYQASPLLGPLPTAGAYCVCRHLSHSASVWQDALILYVDPCTHLVHMGQGYPDKINHATNRCTRIRTFQARSVSLSAATGTSVCPKLCMLFAG